MNNNVEQTTSENTSGEGKNAIIPPGVKGWSWGAFFFPSLWGLGNKVYLLPFLTLIPLVNIFATIMVALKGREMAWQAKRWKSVAHFRKIQRRWAIINFCFVTTLLAIYFILQSLVNNLEPVTDAMSMVNRNLQARTILGSPIERRGNVDINTSEDGNSTHIIIYVDGSLTWGTLDLKLCNAKNQWYVVSLILKTHKDQRVNLTPSTAVPCHYQMDNDNE